MIRVTMTKCHKVIIWKNHLKQLVNGACATTIFPTIHYRIFHKYVTLKFVFALFDSIVLDKFQGYRDSSFLTSCQFFLGNLEPLATIFTSYLEGTIDYYCCSGSITFITLIAIKIKITIIIVITIIIIPISIIIIIIIIMIVEPTKYLKCCGITYCIFFVFCCTLVCSFHFLCCPLHFQE